MRVLEHDTRLKVEMCRMSGIKVRSAMISAEQTRLCEVYIYGQCLGRANALPTQDQESRSTEWYVRNLIAEAAELRTEYGDELWAKGRLGFGRVVERIDCYRWGLVSGLVPRYAAMFSHLSEATQRLLKETTHNSKKYSWGLV